MAGKASQRARYRVKVIIYEISALRYHALLRIPIMGSGCADELRRTSGFNLQGYWKYRLSIWFMRAASLQGRHSQQAAHTRRHLAALQRSGTRSPPGARGPARPPPKAAMVRPGTGRAGGQRAVRFRVGVRAGALWLLLPAGSQARRGRALCAGSALASRWRRWRINRSTSTGG